MNSTDTLASNTAAVSLCNRLHDSANENLCNQLHRLCTSPVRIGPATLSVWQFYFTPPADNPCTISRWMTMVSTITGSSTKTTAR